MALSFALPSSAQTISYDGQRGGGCISVPGGGGTHVFTMASTIPSGDTAVLAIATDANAAVSSVTDPTAGGWTIDNTTLTPGNLELFTYSKRFSSTLSIGQSVTITYTSGSHKSCAAIGIFGNVASVSPVDRTATAQANNDAPSVTLGSPTTQPNELIHVSFATSAGVLLSGPTTYSPILTGFSGCLPADGSGFCIGVYQKIVGATGAYSASDNTLSAGQWGAAMTTYKDTVVPVELLRFDAR